MLTQTEIQAQVLGVCISKSVVFCLDFQKKTMRKLRNNSVVTSKTTYRTSIG
jgi:hypothetical protein